MSEEKKSTLEQIELVGNAVSPNIQATHTAPNNKSTESAKSTLKPR